MAVAEVRIDHFIRAMDNPAATPIFDNIVVDAGINKIRLLRTLLFELPFAKTAAGILKWLGKARDKDNILKVADAKYLPKLLAAANEAEMFEDPYVGFVDPKDNKMFASLEMFSKDKNLEGMGHRKSRSEGGPKSIIGWRPSTGYHAEDTKIAMVCPDSKKIHIEYCLYTEESGTDYDIV